MARMPGQRLGRRLIASFLLLSVATWGDSATPAKSTALDLGHGVLMEFVLIAPGSFTMGTDPNLSDGDETPAHQVTLSQSYYLGKFEVTQQQWTAVMGSNPSHFHGDTLPVENVSWNDCQQFVARLSRLTHQEVALPTEAQWEYACRGGTTARWYFGENDAAVPNYAWCAANASGTTHPVGTKPANPWGLHDMYGNVWEWCADWYANPYPTGAVTDPSGPATGSARVLRGGAWGDEAFEVRSAYRNSMGPEQHNPGSGLRCVLRIRPESKPSTPAAP